MMNSKIFFGVMIMCMIASLNQKYYAKSEIVFAVMAEREPQLEYIALLSESIRTFGGEFSNSPIWVYLPEALINVSEELENKLDELDVELKTVDTPQKALWFYFSRKVYAAAKAENEAKEEYKILAFLNYDTILLNEPKEFSLPENISFGYRPVMHQNIGLKFDEPFDEFWKRSFELMGTDEQSVFPFVTPADGDTIKPYINAGCLIVRPERGILNDWVKKFESLYNDERLTELCGQDIKHRIFIHQVALTGVLLSYLQRDEILELSEKVNYPLFFNEMFGSKKDFHNITGVITFRHEAFFNNPVDGWQDKLAGPSDKINWIIQKLNKE